MDTDTDMADITIIARTAAIEHNVKVITTPPFGDHIYDMLIDVREVVRRVRAGEPIKDLMP